jgi:hypothetical protein
MAAEIVDLGRFRRDAELRRWIHRFDASAPERTPEDFGWQVTDRDQAGRPVAVACARYGATAGYVVGQPDLVWLDYRGACGGYEATLEELLAGVEAGFLPDPVCTFRSAGA